MQLDQIVCRMDGGFGNQLFQYAAARSLADRLGCDLLLDIRALAQQDSRAYGLNSYAIRARVADSSLLATLPPARASRIGRLRSRLGHALPALLPYPVFWSKSFAYDRRVMQITTPVYLVGYWQSEQYFAWNRNRLLQDLCVMDVMPDPMDMKARISATTSVALHIRRGDYISNASASAIHGLCDQQYYVDAVALLANQLKDMHLFVFSDDPAWVQENFTFDVPTLFVDAAQGSSTQFDFEMMRHCQHHIISNSTYSWWAAWLAGHAGQIVVAPRRWFKDASIPSQDVVPQRWVRI